MEYKNKNKKSSEKSNNKNNIVLIKEGESKKIKIKISYKIYFFFSILLFYYYFEISSTKKNIKDLNGRVCICTLGKEENKYIREFVYHYKNYGVDKIYLYDNNDINGEYFESVINDYIREEFVEILNWRGKKKIIYNIMNECYYKNNNNYDWIIFYELDEFIHLSNYTNVKTFLKEKKFYKCQIIYLNLIVHNDNSQLYYQNISLFKRFPNKVSKSIENLLQVKMIIKGGIKGIRINSTAHCYLLNNNYHLIKCNGFGEQITQNGFLTDKTDYDFYYIDHFFCKSTEEFVNKLVKGDALKIGKALEKYKINRIKRYFKYNILTKKKIEIIEKGLKLKLNLSSFKNEIKI